MEYKILCAQICTNANLRMLIWSDLQPWFWKKCSDTENDGSSSDSGVDEKEKCPRSITPVSGNWRRWKGSSPAKAAFMKFS